MGKKIGQFGQNLAKSGQSLEKFSQPSLLRFYSNFLEIHVLQYEFTDQAD